MANQTLHQTPQEMRISKPSLVHGAGELNVESWIEAGHRGRVKDNQDLKKTLRGK